MDYRDLEQRIARERGLRAWLRSRSRPVRLGLAAALLALFALAIVFLHPRKDLPTYPRARLLLAVGGLAILGLVTVWHVFRPLHRPAASPWIAYGLFLAGVGALVVWAALPELPTVGVPDHLAPSRMIHCFVIGGVSGAALVGLLLTLDRGGRTGVEMVFYGAAFGGLAGNIGLVLFCPNNAPLHLLFGHATVPLGLIVLLAIGRSAILRRRASRRPPSSGTPSPP